MKTTPDAQKKRRQESLHPEKGALSGLCSCCKSARSCTYGNGFTRPVLQCEEFEGILPSTIAAVDQGDRAQEGLSKKPLSIEGELTRFQGLCNLCENRATCTFPKLEGGVWHCEEYR